MTVRGGIFCIVLVLTASLSSAAASSCPDGWTPNTATSKCYKVSYRMRQGFQRYLQFVDNFLCWEKAEQNCESEDGQLVTIGSKEENDWIAGTFSLK